MAAAVISSEDRGKCFVCQLCRESHSRKDLCGHEEVGSGLDRKLQNTHTHTHTPHTAASPWLPRDAQGSQDMIILEEKLWKVKSK